MRQIFRARDFTVASGVNFSGSAALAVLLFFLALELPPSRSAIPEDLAMSTVLLVGEDQVLLETRAAVLRTTGAETLC